MGDNSEVKKAAARALICVLGLAPLSVAGYTQKPNLQTDVVEVSDLDSLREAVAAADLENGPVTGQADMWQNKRLLVKSETEFNTKGAETVICGYDQMYILDYPTREDTKKAYDYLKTLPQLTVEVDYMYEEAAQADLPLNKSASADRTNLSGGAGLTDGEVSGSEGSQGSGDASGSEGPQGNGGVSGSEGPSGSGDASGSEGPSGSGDASGSEGPQGSGDAFGSEGPQGSGDVSGGGGLQGGGDVSGAEGSPGSRDTSGSEGEQGGGALSGNEAFSGGGVPSGNEAFSGGGDVPGSEVLSESGDLHEGEASSGNGDLSEDKASSGSGERSGGGASSADDALSGQGKAETGNEPEAGDLLPQLPGTDRVKEGVYVAVLDSGYDVYNYGSTRLSGGTDITASGGISDENGHGTAIANIILGHTPDLVKVMPIKVADESGRTSSLKLYLGICYAIENGADIINISMSAYQASNLETVGAAIRRARQAGIFVVVSAGNEGKDASGFSPSDIEETIVVSAVNADKTRWQDSNYGACVDYCSYGEIEVNGLNGEPAGLSGTSVSSAIVSAVIAAYQSAEKGLSYESVIALLDQKAEDLGQTGRDEYYGKGFLALEGMKAVGESQEEEEALPQLLACDWKQLSDEALNALIGSSDEWIVRRFLDQKRVDEREEILKRAHILQNDHVEIICGMDGKEQRRNVDTLYNYLYSDRFDAYDSQKKIDGTFYMYIQNTSRRVYLYTNKDETKCTLHVKFSGTKTNPADNPTITVSGTSAGAIQLSGAKVDSVKTFTDDNGNANTIGQVGIVGITIKKRAHSKITGQKKTITLKENHGSNLWSGGFTGYGNNSCAAVESAGCKLMVGIGDLELNKENKVQAYQISLTNYPISAWSEWNDWTVTQNAFCFQPGSRFHTRTKTCANCGKTADTEKKTETIAQLSHNFVNVPWMYGDNHNIANGERWRQCSYACKTAAGSGYDVNGAFWRKDYQYLQQIWYRYMDTDGQYPAEYTAFINDYYSPNAKVPGWNDTQTEESEFKSAAGADSYTVTDQARITYVNVPRKAYRVVYDGNGAKSGFVPSQEVYCGEVFDLNKNGFKRTGYTFQGWSKTPDGTVLKDIGVKNLSLTDGASVILYARWKMQPYQITLDNQGANLEQGTKLVYEGYAKGYYQNAALTRLFASGCIRIPQKQRKDSTLIDGVRRQQFLGYYTGKNGKGFRFAEKDGTLKANLNGAGDYCYFQEDSVVYADWADMCAVQFDANLSEQDMELLRQDENGKNCDTPVICPFTCWSAKGENITVSYGEALIQNETFANIYRFKGWSLTPEIKDNEELILSLDKQAYTFTANRDITLYAQWDTSFLVAYVGNGQTDGADYVEKVSSVTDMYTFRPNEESGDGHFFVKTSEKPTMDIASGQMQNAAGQPYLEQVLYRFLGWSVIKDGEQQKKQEILYANDDVRMGGAILLNAKNSLSFGALPSDFGECGTLPAWEEITVSKSMPVVTVYAVWDEYPQIHAADVYAPLWDAVNGILTEEYLLGLAKATDEELKSNANQEGVFKQGMDTAQETSFTILDYQSADFTEADQEMNLTITYRAKDKVGNVTTKMVRIYLVDTSGKIEATGKVRFISQKYIDTLAEDSIWRSGAYAETLSRVLSNKKIGEEYTKVSPVQKAFGVKSVPKPYSGAWEHVQEVWEFTHDEVLEIQDYLQSAGVGGAPSEFIEKFGRCRIQ